MHKLQSLVVLAITIPYTIIHASKPHQIFKRNVHLPATNQISATHEESLSDTLREQKSQLMAAMVHNNHRILDIIEKPADEQTLHHAYQVRELTSSNRDFSLLVESIQRAELNEAKLDKLRKAENSLFSKFWTRRKTL
jgi:hypothetical protein